MAENNIISGDRVAKATGWSFAGEIAAKLISPITNMILARLLAPEIFGIVATINMVVSLSDIFTEAGFQLYLVQHEFRDDDELRDYLSSALWVSVAIGIVMFSAIALFREQIAILVGSPGYGNAVMVASTSIPITAAISILSALYRRNLNYKPLFIRRLLGLIVPLIITVPFALLGWGVWALILGTIAGRVVNLVALLVDKNYHPKLRCQLTHIAKMAPFCVTTLISYILSWATNWIDILIIGNILGTYYTGLYKNSQSTVIGILAMFTAAFTPVLFSVLCRYSNDNNKFTDTMCEFTNKLSFILLPIGFGILACRRLLTYVLLGSNWMEASDFIGIWGLVTVFSAVYATYCREACRAKGKPYLNVIAQTVSLCFIIPASYFGAKMGFQSMIYLRSAAALILILAYYVILHYNLKINPLKIFKVTLPYMISSIIMALCLFVLRELNDTLQFEILLVAVGVMTYFLVLALFPQKRIMMINSFKKINQLIKIKFTKRGK